jgi:hypothetical protein
MLDDEFFAELVRLINNGIEDGGAERVNSFYKNTTDQVFSEKKQLDIKNLLAKIIGFLDSDIGQVLKGELGKHYQIYSIIAAFLCINKHITHKDIEKKQQMLDKNTIITNFGELERQLSNDEDNEFVKASSSSTQRIANRITRINYYINAMGI